MPAHARSTTPTHVYPARTGSGCQHRRRLHGPAATRVREHRPAAESLEHRADARRPSRARRQCRRDDPSSSLTYFLLSTSRLLFTSSTSLLLHFIDLPHADLHHRRIDADHPDPRRRDDADEELVLTRPEIHDVDRGVELSGFMI